MARFVRPVDDVVGRAIRAFWNELASQTDGSSANPALTEAALLALTRSAQDAFWAAVAALFPGASGDLAPLDDAAITRAAERAVVAWAHSGTAIEPDDANWNERTYVADFEIAAEQAVTAWVDANVGIRRSTVGLIGDRLIERSRKLT